ncbi:MAG TPA: PadR family transcriptional regulator [Roseiflexaceae bacterium]|nr:PadR family transcriptional regulator [Roseiflexaceae bacterium]
MFGHPFRRHWPHHHHGMHEEHDEAWFSPRGRGGPFGGPFRRGGPWGDPSDEDGGGRQRQRRGDIKFALLELLAEQPRHGYELMNELEQRYGGFYRPSPGSVYPTLQMLEDEGHLTSEQVEGKRVYTITDSGRKALAERQQHAGPEAHGRHGFRGPRHAPELHELRQSGMALMASLMQVAQHGTPEQVRAATKLLEATRREIYALLARNETPDDVM